MKVLNYINYITVSFTPHLWVSLVLIKAGMKEANMAFQSLGNINGTLLYRGHQQNYSNIRFRKSSYEKTLYCDLFDDTNNGE